MREVDVVLLMGALLFAGCKSSPAPTPPLEVTANTEVSPSVVDVAPSAEKATWEFFEEEIDLDADAYLNSGTKELGDGLVLLGNFRAPRALLHLDTLDLTPLPPLPDDPGRNVAFHAVPEAGLLVAAIELKEEQVVRFQALRLAAKQWEAAGQFDIPPSRSAHSEDHRYSAVWIVVQDGMLFLRLTDRLEVKSTYALDADTLVWNAAPKPPEEPGPCMLSLAPTDDRVRWGMAKSEATDRAKPCIAVRQTVSDPWRRIEDPSDEVIFMRTVTPIDGTRFLVTGGFKFALFPFVDRVEIVDVAKGSIRALGKHSLGSKMNVPGESWVWLDKDSVTRFDPDTEAFHKSPGPTLDFQPRWWIRLDDQRILFAGEDRDKNAKYVIAGFRPAR